MGKKWVAILVMGGLLGGMGSPYVVQANAELDKLNQQIQQLKQQQKEAQEQSARVEQQIQSNQVQQGQLNADIRALDDSIGATEKKQEQLNRQIGQTKVKAQQAAQALGEAEDRVAQRDDLLKTRVRLMYENGDVNYLEVLLGANSFGDFLARFDALKTITEQDQRILQENKQDRETVAQKKQEVDTQLGQLKGLFAKAEQLKAELVQNQQKKKVRIAALQDENGNLEEIKAEESKQLMALASQSQALLRKKNQLMTRGDAAIYKGGQFAWPLVISGTITSPFGYRKDPFTGKTAGHDGLDIAAPQGTTIVAAAAGTVLISGTVNGFGNTVILDHGDNLWTLYGHIRPGGLKVEVGQQVKQGQKIAEVGTTGRSTGPHVHFQVTKNGVPVNPMNYLKK